MIPDPEWDNAPEGQAAWKAETGASPWQITDFKPPLHGWYAVNGRLVVLSFVVSLEEGKGHVSDLLAKWKREYDEIQVPTPSNRMRGLCERRGFKSEMVWMEEVREYGECMVWRKGAQ